MARVELRTEPFDPWQFLAEHQAGQAKHNARSGAAAVFVGSMRDFNEGDSVQSMFLEHYPGMTEQQLETLVTDAMRQWKLDNAVLLHRVGEILPAESIVLIAVWSAHRAAAFEACRHLIEILKHTAPFWKKETLADGSQRWVEQNTPG